MVDRLPVGDRSRGSWPREWIHQALTSAVQRLAAHLRGSGLGQEAAGMTETSVDFVIAHHGLLAAGGGVLYLDPFDNEAGWEAELTGFHSAALVAEGALGPAPLRMAKGMVRIGPHWEDSVPWSQAIASREATGFAPGGDRRTVLMSFQRHSGTAEEGRRGSSQPNGCTGPDRDCPPHRRRGSGSAGRPAAAHLGHVDGHDPLLRVGGTPVITAACFRLAEPVGRPSLPELLCLRLIVSGGGGPLVGAATTSCARRTGSRRAGLRHDRGGCSSGRMAGCARNSPPWRRPSSNPPTRARRCC